MVFFFVDSLEFILDDFFVVVFFFGAFFVTFFMVCFFLEDCFLEDFETASVAVVLAAMFSAVFAALGLFLMSTLTGGALFFGAAVFAVGVTYLWPTMIGFVAEYIPKSGALGLGLIGGAGMFAVSIFQPFIGKIYDTRQIR